MGAGKTTVGRELAARVDAPFFDLDDLIEAAEKMSIKDIFAAARRAVLPQARARHPPLHAAISNAASSPPAAARSPSTRTSSSSSPKGCRSTFRRRMRCCAAAINDKAGERPLFRDDLSTHELYANRIKYYRMSDITLEVREDETPAEIVERLLLELPKSFPRRRDDGVEARVRALVVSDLHSNAEALRAVMTPVRRKKFDHIVCLGDFVGYGAQPNQVLDSMRTFNGRRSSTFAAITTAWPRDSMTPRASTPRPSTPRSGRASISARRIAAFFATFPSVRCMRDGVHVCHGSPLRRGRIRLQRPSRRAGLRSATRASSSTATRTCRSIFALDENGYVEGVAIRGDATLRLSTRYRYLINPGSVGQPRDRNPQRRSPSSTRQAFTVQFFRVEYDVQEDAGVDPQGRSAGDPGHTAPVRHVTISAF